MNLNKQSATDNSVRVIIRIRPQPQQEVTKVTDALGSKFNICVKAKAPPNTKIDNQLHKFKFDVVLGPNVSQQHVYECCAKNLVDRCFSGFSNTILAYGEPGCGKSYTLGTEFELSALYDVLDPSSQGIIPRVINQLFEEMDNRIKRAKEKLQPQPNFYVTVQFLQLYENKITNLLDENFKNSNSNHTTSQPVRSAIEALNYLQQGALARTTISSDLEPSMYDALFAISIQQSKTDCDTLTSRFNFIDLAVRKRSEINDQKLMRLLQNSLGKDNRTVLIACISPREVLGTLNTLTLADKAKNIKAKNAKASGSNDENHNNPPEISHRETTRNSVKLDNYNFGDAKRIVNIMGKGKISTYDVEWEDGSIRRFHLNAIPRQILNGLRKIRRAEKDRISRRIAYIRKKEKMMKQREQIVEQRYDIKFQNKQDESLLQPHKEGNYKPPIIFSPTITGPKMKITPKRLRTIFWRFT